MSGLFARAMPAGPDEFRGSAPKSPHRAAKRLVPVGLVDPRHRRLLITFFTCILCRVDLISDEAIPSQAAAAA